jgi:hypothetical protein
MRGMAAYLEYLDKVIELTLYDSGSRVISKSSE